MTRKILAASLAVLFTVSMVFVGFTNDVQGHSIGGSDKSFILCAFETDGQTIYPDNDIDSLIVGSATGVFYPESWTFVLIDADDIEEVDSGDYPAGLRDHDTVNGQDHSGTHYNCKDTAVASASAPGPSISVNLCHCQDR